MNQLEGRNDARGLRIAIVVSRYHDFVTDRLLDGAMAALRQAGADEADLDVIRVPGAFEVPLASKRAADTGRYNAIVCLGCLIRGETPHFDYISAAASHGIVQASLATGVPMAFGILTTNSAEQALARTGTGTANKGWEAASSAIEMASLYGTIGDRAGRGAV